MNCDISNHADTKHLRYTQKERGKACSARSAERGALLRAAKSKPSQRRYDDLTRTPKAADCYSQVSLAEFGFATSVAFELGVIIAKRDGSSPFPETADRLPIDSRGLPILTENRVPNQAANATGCAYNAKKRVFLDIEKENLDNVKHKSSV